VADWYLAAYVDAVEWAELPNTAGMASTPTRALHQQALRRLGAYVKRMSNYCAAAATTLPPARVTGVSFTVLYWNFLDRHAAPSRATRAPP